MKVGMQVCACVYVCVCVIQLSFTCYPPAACGTGTLGGSSAPLTQHICVPTCAIRTRTPVSIHAHIHALHICEAYLCIIRTHVPHDVSIRAHVHVLQEYVVMDEQAIIEEREEAFDRNLRRLAVRTEPIGQDRWVGSCWRVLL